MYKRIVYPIVLLLVALGSLQAQTSNIIISGRVLAADQLPIPAASLRINGQGAKCDSLGFYKLAAPLDSAVWLICSSTGFARDSVLISGNIDTVRIDFQLKPIENELSGVSIVQLRKSAELPRIYTLNEYDIVTTPGATADVSAALQTFPGAAPAGNETGLFVHGGSAQETQAFFDGMLVKNAFGSRLPDVANRSRFSAFLFERTAFTGGQGYTSEYGQALSSAFIMDTKGVPAESSTEFSFVSLGAGAAHTQRFKNASLMVGANYYNFGVNNRLIPQNTRWRMDPIQYQSSVHYKQPTARGGMFKVYADYSDTQLSFDIRNPIRDTLDRIQNRNRNLYLNTTFKEYLWDDWKLFAGLSYNVTLETGHVNTEAYHQTDHAWHEKITLTKNFGNGTALTGGVEQFQTNRDEGYSALNRAYHDILSAGFLSADILFNKVLSLTAGIRSEYSRYIQQVNAAPRLGLNANADSRSRFSLNYARYYQKPDDSYLAQVNDLDFERADSYALLYELKLPARNLKLEAYYKDYDQLVKIRTPVFSGYQAYGPPIIINAFNNQGNGYARGFDIFWRDQHLAAGEYYISYSYLDTRRNYIDYPASARPPFAPEHTLNLVARKFISKFRTQLSGTYTYSRGRTYFDPRSTEFLSDRTRDFHNLSVGFSYLPPWGKAFTVINVTASNILGFDQVYGYRFSYDGKRQETILPPSKRGLLVSFLLSIGGGSFNH